MWVIARGSGARIAHLTVLAHLTYLRRVVAEQTAIVAEPVITVDKDDWEENGGQPRELV
jgi:hypothetical protein